LTAGRFPGCCQPGLADAPRLPGHPDWTELPPGVIEEMKTLRKELGRPEPVRFHMRSPSGEFREGRGCPWLGENGCKLGCWKPPLCFSYVCPPVMERLSKASGGLDLGDSQDFCGASTTLRAVAEKPLDQAQAAVETLEQRLTILDQSLGAAELCDTLDPEPDET
jgi:hypothetical protein